MPLREHVLEARNRLLAVLIGIVPGFILGWICYPYIFAWLSRPLLAVDPGHTVELNFATVAGSLDMQVKVSLYAAVLLTSPWWIYQGWAFITPGLRKIERRVAIGFVGAGFPLFLAGVALCWLVMPQAIRVLLGFTPSHAVNIIDAGAYLSFVMHMTWAFGAAFLLPVVMVALTMVQLTSTRTWLRGWRWAVVLSAIFAAAATPTSDVVSMLVLAVPMCMLYFLAIGVCALLERKRKL